MISVRQIQMQLARWSLTRKQKQAFLEDLSALLEEGVALNQAVSTLSQVNQGAVQSMANHVLQKIAEGKGLALGLLTWYPLPIVEVIRAGEEGGTLISALQNAAESLTSISSIIGGFIAAVLYPITVLTAGIMVSIFIRDSVFEDFAQIKLLAGWPANGQTLYYLAGFMKEWWWLLLLAVVIFFIMVVELLRNLTGSIRQRIDQIPLISAYRTSIAASFMETLGLLVSNGVSFKKALSLMQIGSPRYLGWHLLQMEYQLSRGKENIAEVLDTGLIPPHEILRLKAIAQGRGFSHALARLGKQAKQRNEKHLKLIARITGGGCSQPVQVMRFL